jgi:hypothetical protein
MHQLRVLAPEEAANVFPVWRRSWNRKPSGSPASATHFAQRTDRWKLIRRNAAPIGPLKIRFSGSLGGNSARCSRTTATSTEGKATVRNPASDFGLPGTRSPFCSSANFRTHYPSVKINISGTESHQLTPAQAGESGEDHQRPKPDVT